MITRRLASASLALVAVLSLGACATRSPMQTTVAYSPADGVPVDLGPVQIRGLVVVSEAKGDDGALSGQVVNNSGKTAQLTFTTSEGDPVTVEVDPGSTSFGTDRSAAVGKVDAGPGAMLHMAVSTNAGGTAEVYVPVLSPTGYYSTVTVPAPAATPAQPTPQQ